MPNIGSHLQSIPEAILVISVNFIFWLFRIPSLLLGPDKTDRIRSGEKYYVDVRTLQYLG